MKLLEKYKVYILLESYLGSINQVTTSLILLKLIKWIK